MNRYENGNIYKVADLDFNKCYMGSTTEPLSKRMERHRRLYQRYNETGKVDTRCCSLFDKYGVENCKFLLLEDYPCKTKEELLRREGEYIKKNECLNRCVARRIARSINRNTRNNLKQKDTNITKTIKKHILKEPKNIRNNIKKILLNENTNTMRQTKTLHQTRNGNTTRITKK